MYDNGRTMDINKKITEEFNKPTILMSEVDGLLKGSARSVEGLNIFECLKKFQEYFISFGGHSKAAGITMKIDMFDEFTERINEFVSKKYPSNVFMPTIKYDCEINIDLITLELFEKLKLLEPFGEGNEKPVFLGSFEGMI